MLLVRRLAAATAAGVLVGLLVGGVWGRAFMAILAALNSEDRGTRTDDGFAMGQFTLSGSLNLAVVTMVLGAIGGLVFLGVRGLRFGPGWFRTASLSAGATLVLGSMLVHSDGVDFTLLEPLGLAVAFTLSVPLLYAVGLTWLADRWLGDGPTFWQRLPDPVLHVARAGLTVVAAVSAVDLVRTVLDVLDGNQFT